MTSVVFVGPPTTNTITRVQENLCHDQLTNTIPDGHCHLNVSTLREDSHHYHIQESASTFGGHNLPRLINTPPSRLEGYGLVTALVLKRDDSSGGWLPIEGGGLSNVGLYEKLLKPLPITVTSSAGGREQERNTPSPDNFVPCRFVLANNTTLSANTPQGVTTKNVPSSSLNVKDDYPPKPPNQNLSPLNQKGTAIPIPRSSPNEQEIISSLPPPLSAHQSEAPLQFPTAELIWIYSSTPCSSSNSVFTDTVAPTVMTSAFKILGRRILDNTSTLDCSVDENLKYYRANPTFHHWKTGDDSKYGLNFQSPHQAISFDSSLQSVIHALRERRPKPQGAAPVQEGQLDFSWPSSNTSVNEPVGTTVLPSNIVTRLGGSRVSEKSCQSATKQQLQSQLTAINSSPAYLLESISREKKFNRAKSISAFRLSPPPPPLPLRCVDRSNFNLFPTTPCAFTQSTVLNTSNPSTGISKPPNNNNELRSKAEEDDFEMASCDEDEGKVTPASKSSIGAASKHERSSTALLNRIYWHNEPPPPLPTSSSITPPPPPWRQQSSWSGGSSSAHSARTTPPSIYLHHQDLVGGSHRYSHKSSDRIFCKCGLPGGGSVAGKAAMCGESFHHPPAQIKSYPGGGKNSFETFTNKIISFILPSSSVRSFASKALPPPPLQQPPLPCTLSSYWSCTYRSSVSQAARKRESNIEAFTCIPYARCLMYVLNIDKQHKTPLSSQISIPHHAPLKNKALPPNTKARKKKKAKLDGCPQASVGFTAASTLAGATAGERAPDEESYSLKPSLSGHETFKKLYFHELLKHPMLPSSTKLMNPCTCTCYESDSSTFSTPDEETSSNLGDQYNSPPNPDRGDGKHHHHSTRRNLQKIITPPRGVGSGADISVPPSTSDVYYGQNRYDDGYYEDDQKRRKFSPFNCVARWCVLGLLSILCPCLCLYPCLKTCNSLHHRCRSKKHQRKKNRNRDRIPTPSSGTFSLS